MFSFTVINKTSNANASFALYGAANCDYFGLCWSVPESRTTDGNLIIFVPLVGLAFAFSDRNFVRTKHVFGRYYEGERLWRNSCWISLFCFSLIRFCHL